jgi:hypothetical protein
VTARPIGKHAVTNAFDILGDAHGQFDKLVALLSHLGYRERGGTRGHPSRTASATRAWNTSPLAGRV